MLTSSQASLYRRLTIGDEMLLKALFTGDRDSDSLDSRTRALVRLAALIVADAAAPAYQTGVRDAIGAGATPDQMTAVLVEIARVAGSSLVMSAAPKLAMALGYDVDAAFEDGDALEGDDWSSPAT